MEAPRTVYSRSLEERRAGVAALESRHHTLGYLKLAMLGALAAIALAALLYHGLSILWEFLPAALLLVFSVAHERVIRRLQRSRRAQGYFEKALARLEGTWAGKGEPGDRYLDPAHPYALDLDLFGKGSVFELLSTARTRVGEDTLARWLLAPAEPAVVRSRNAAVEELRPRLDLREQLAVLAEEAHSGVDPTALARWGETPPLLPGGALNAGAWVLTASGALAVAAFIWFNAVTFGLIRMPESNAVLLRDFFLAALVANCAFLYRMRNRIHAIVAAVDEAAHELKLLSEVLLRLEREEFQSPLLNELRRQLDSEGDPPSKRMAHLERLTALLDSRDHLLVRALEPFTLWTAHLAFGVERWRRHNGAAVRRWLTATGEIEALCSLASHAFEHPSDTFPEFAEDTACLNAEQIGHPLLPGDRVVRNDVRICGDLRLLVVSGSNMSGKSTLLRTLGVNAVLAQAGGTVRAGRLRLSPLAIGASIRVSDSLQGGVSRFYAEILRLRQILDLTSGPLPVLFLVDEFLHGTNSHDRRIGAEALVRGLVERGAIGLITTHDLALADIAGALPGRASNVHFEDQLEDGQIRFDYRMQPGVVQKSNALALMRSVGLEI